jgi:hypothetical protein
MVYLIGLNSHLKKIQSSLRKKGTVLSGDAFEEDTDFKPRF